MRIELDEQTFKVMTQWVQLYNEEVQRLVNICDYWVFLKGENEKES